MLQRFDLAGRSVGRGRVGAVAEGVVQDAAPAQVGHRVDQVANLHEDLRNRRPGQQNVLQPIH